MECFEFKKMLFHAYHGVMKQELIVGNTFQVDLKLFLDLSQAVQTDNLEDTVNYADIFNLVKEEMATPSHLLEHIAGRIVQKIKQKYPAIAKITIRLAKLNPPVQGEVQAAAVILSI